MSGRCGRVRALLHRDATALSEAERLVLEGHLQTCQRCDADRAQLLILRDAGASLPATSIGPRGHARAIARALLEGSRPAAEPARGWRWAFVVADVAIAATLIAVRLASRAAGPSTAQAPPAPAPARSARPAASRPPAASTAAWAPASAPARARAAPTTPAIHAKTPAGRS